MFWKKGDWVSMNLKKSVITSIRTSGDFSTDGLVKHTSEMNRRIEKNIQKNEKKIALGLKRTKGMQTK